MGFKVAKWNFIERLVNMDFDTDTDRKNLEIKNKLYTGDVDTEFVLNKIRKCRGDNYDGTKVCKDADDKKYHIFKIDGWYFKYYLKRGIMYILSVHEEEHHV